MYRIAVILAFIITFPYIGNAQQKRAFLVGISDYTNKTALSDEDWVNIHGTNDVELLSKTLRKQKFSITTVKNQQATAEKIRKGLNEFARSCKPGDLVYLHFSCHGQPVEDKNGDEADKWDEAIIPIDAKKVYTKGRYTGENHILDDELNGYFRTIRRNIGPKGFVYVIVDACHAGTSYRGDEEEDSTVVRGTNRGFSSSGKIYTPKIDKRGKIKIENNAQMSGICIVEACRSYQSNSEIRENGVYYGSLSFYVNKVLQESRLGRNMSWINKVSNHIKSDIRLPRQDLVIETSMDR